VNVTRLALEMAERLRVKGIEVDTKLMEVGALLHDIGRGVTHDVDHAAVGGRMIREMGLPEEVARIVDRHVGGGIPIEEAKRLGLPEGVYMPETLEEKLVAYADKLICGSKVVDIKVTVDDFASKLGHGHPAIQRLLDLHEEMSQLLGVKGF
jgi:uncharacterized protein